MTPAERLAAAPRDLPRGWSVRTLDEAASWYSGGTPSKAVRQYWDGPIPWVSPKDMKAFELHDVADHVSEAAAEHGTRVVPADTIFVVVRGMILAHTFPVSIAGRAMAFNQDVKGVVVKPDVHPRFLGHWFVASSHELLRLATASTHGTKKIDLPDLLQFPVRLPPLNEQRRIAEILDTADEGIRSSEAIIAKLREERSGIALRMLVDAGGRNAEMSTVDVEFAITAGIALGPHRRPRLNRMKYLRVANVLRDQLELGDVLEMEATADEAASRKLAPGDLLVVEGHANPDEIGRCARVDEAAEGMLFQNHLFRLRTAGRVSSEFGVLWLNSSTVRRYWRRMCGTSSGLNTINRTMLASVPVSVPSAYVQRRVVEVIRAADTRVRAEETCLGKLKLQKHGLMQDLLTGRVRVNS